MGRSSPDSPRVHPKLRLNGDKLIPFHSPLLAHDTRRRAHRQQRFAAAQLSLRVGALQRTLETSDFLKPSDSVPVRSGVSTRAVQNRVFPAPGLLGEAALKNLIDPAPRARKHTGDRPFTPDHFVLEKHTVGTDSQSVKALKLVGQRPEIAPLASKPLDGDAQRMTWLRRKPPQTPQHLLSDAHRNHSESRADNE